MTTVGELKALLDQFDDSKRVVLEYDNEYEDIRVVIAHKILIGPDSYADHVGVEVLKDVDGPSMVTQAKREEYKCAPQEDVVVISMRPSWM